MNKLDKPWKFLIYQIAKLIDFKNIVTMAIIGTLVYVVMFSVDVTEQVLILFSNLATAVITYYFTKPNKKKEATLDETIEGPNYEEL